MKGKIDEAGVLWVNRGSDWKMLDCPYVTRFRELGQVVVYHCCDSCSMFNEEFGKDHKGSPMRQHKIIRFNCCHNPENTTCDIIEDRRVRR